MMASSACSLDGGSALARLMPMFVLVDEAGVIRLAGPTIGHVCQQDIVGRSFDKVFRSTRGGALPSGGLAGLWGRAVHIGLCANPQTTLRALVVPARLTPSGADIQLGLRGGKTEPAAGMGALVNMSFGIDLAEAARRHALTGANFAHTDLAMELLYLQEAKAAVMKELQALNARLEHARRAAEDQALTDPLTGLSNRRALEVQLGAMVDQLHRGGEAFAIMHLDLDHFKEVNDIYGHAAGDAVLIRVAEFLRAEIRRSDIAARVGGDEFVLLLRGFEDVTRLQQMGQRLIDCIEQPIPVDGGAAAVSVSIGVVIARPGCTADADQLLSAADAALYVSKREGRARCTVDGSG